MYCCNITWSASIEHFMQDTVRISKKKNRTGTALSLQNRLYNWFCVCLLINTYMSGRIRPQACFHCNIPLVVRWWGRWPVLFSYLCLMETIGTNQNELNNRKPQISWGQFVSACYWPRKWAGSGNILERNRYNYHIDCESNIGRQDNEVNFKRKWIFFSCINLPIGLSLFF